MVLVSHLSYKQASANQTKKKENMKIKKDLWINEEGEVKEGTANGLPKGWAKGKLIARAGEEISDLEAKEYGLKAENKAKKVQDTK
jgi:hypothetical protein